MPNRNFYLFPLRFSMLTIFIASFLCAIMTMATITYIRVSKDIHQVAYNLMQEVGDKAYKQIAGDITNTEIQSRFTANLIRQRVIDIRNHTEMLNYFYSTLSMMSQILPSLQLIYWGDETGSIYAVEKKDSGEISSQYIRRDVSPPSHQFVFFDTEGCHITNRINSTDFSYDPRDRPWFKLALEKKSLAWTEVYKSQFTNKLVATLAEPVYDDSHTLIGILGFNFRLDYLQHFVENIQSSEHGIVFIATNTGNLVAYPNVSQYKNDHLIKITDAPNQHVIEAFKLYQKLKEPKFDFSVNGIHYLAVFQPLKGDFFNDKWIVGVLAPESDFVDQLRKTNMLLMIIGLVILFIGIIFVTIVITRIVKPLRKVIAETERIQHFELDGDPEIKSHISEIVALTNAIKSMKNGLRIFKKYLPATLVRQLIEAGDDIKVGGQKMDLAILFSDIQDFTSIAEKMNPEALLSHLSDYFQMTSTIIKEQRGTIDKYIGDSIMAFWGAPLVELQPCHQAAVSALSMMSLIAAKNIEWQQTQKPVLITRIGLHFGEAIVGNIGSSERLNYTAIGNDINIASRLESVNKIYGTKIMVSEGFYEKIKTDFLLRKVDKVILKGKSTSMYVYELLANDVNFDIQLYQKSFDEAFFVYTMKDWLTAIKIFNQCIAIYPNDTVAPVFIERCNHFMKQPPRENWDGVWEFNDNR